VVQQASRDTRSSLQLDLAETMRRIEVQPYNSQDLQKELTPFINEATSRTMKTIVSISQQYAARLESPADPNSIAGEILNRLTPHLTAICPMPINYDTLASWLSWVVMRQARLVGLTSNKCGATGKVTIIWKWGVTSSFRNSMHTCIYRSIIYRSIQ
jgi:hypothetical protein